MVSFCWARQKKLQIFLNNSSSCQIGERALVNSKRIIGIGPKHDWSLECFSCLILIIRKFQFNCRVPPKSNVNGRGLYRGNGWFPIRRLTNTFSLDICDPMPTGRLWASAFSQGRSTLVAHRVLTISPSIGSDHQLRTLRHRSARRSPRSRRVKS